MKITKEEVLSALNCCKRQTLEACERCPLQGRCRDGKLLFEACIKIIKNAECKRQNEAQNVKQAVKV